MQDTNEQLGLFGKVKSPQSETTPSTQSPYGVTSSKNWIVKLRGLRHARQQRNPVQPRVLCERNVRDTENHPRRGTHPNWTGEALPHLGNLDANVIGGMHGTTWASPHSQQDTPDDYVLQA